MSDEQRLSAGQTVATAPPSGKRTAEGTTLGGPHVYNGSGGATTLSISSSSSSSNLQSNGRTETVAETVDHAIIPQLALDIGSEQTPTRASSASPVPSITISGPASPEGEEGEEPRPAMQRIPSIGASGGGLHPRRSRSLSAGARVGGGPSMDMKAMETPCEVPEHSKAVNTIRDLKSEIEELKELVEQGGKREDEFSKLVDEKRTLEKRFEEREAEMQELRTKTEKFKRERDDYLRIKNRLNRELQERRKDKPCRVAEHEELSLRVQRMESEQEEMRNSRECSMPIHHQFLAEYAAKINEQDKEIRTLWAVNDKLSAMDPCNLPMHKVILKEYHDQVNIMDKEIQAKDKVIEEQERMAQQDGLEISGHRSQLEAMEGHLEGQKAKLGQDLKSVIDEMKRQEKDMDGWIANIAQRDVYTREITDEDLERLHKIYLDRSNGFRALKKTMVSSQPEEPANQGKGDQVDKSTRLEQWAKKKEDVVAKSIEIVERLQKELKERDVEMIALKKGAKISIDQSAMDPDHFDLKWELDDKYRTLINFGVHLKLVDQEEALKKLQEVELPNAKTNLEAFKKAIEEKRQEVHNRIMHRTGEAPKTDKGLRRGMRNE
ncbi:uncharacterized protein IWZ02DRAFT_440078 [Phyllosticta citriasiana]|uniref:Uncharacterized protein n=1 Tax=Phyllosticta citriasiana TaxID=595635 RepID=A0ABR1KBJ3_9PEZI